MNVFWAHSKVVLRGIRIAEAGVRFSLGPPKVHPRGWIFDILIMCDITNKQLFTGEHRLMLLGEHIDLHDIMA